VTTYTIVGYDAIVLGAPYDYQSPEYTDRDNAQALFWCLSDATPRLYASYEFHTTEVLDNGIVSTRCTSSSHR